jgi:rare lipoprotein A (peptidoglycan hydrolase)
MKTTFKAILAAGTTVIFMVVGPLSGEAKAETVVSSWYGPGFEGSPTASGELYRAEAYTAAHRSLPFGTELLVTYGSQQAVVRVTDRGPYVAGRDIDLSQGAAEEIGLTTAGADAVDLRVLADTPVYEAPPPSKNPPSSNSYSSSNRKRDGVAAFLRERPYLRVLGAEFASYSRTVTKGCQEASMTAPTPTAGTRLPSVEATRARVVAMAERCPSGTHSL